MDLSSISMFIRTTSTHFATFGTGLITNHMLVCLMRLNGSGIRLSATDLAKHLACRHLTALDFLAAKGEIRRPHRNDPTVDVLEDRGRRHEAAYLDHLKAEGKDVLLDEAALPGDARLE